MKKVMFVIFSRCKGPVSHTYFPLSCALAQDMNRSFIIPSRSGGHRDLNLAGDMPTNAKELYSIWECIRRYRGFQAKGFVMQHIDAKVGTRKNRNSVDIEYEIPMEAVAEAIVNACVHRSYESTGSVQVMLFKDRLEVWNPGTLPYGMTTAKLKQLHSHWRPVGSRTAEIKNIQECTS